MRWLHSMNVNNEQYTVYNVYSLYNLTWHDLPPQFRWFIQFYNSSETWKARWYHVILNNFLPSVSPLLLRDVADPALPEEKLNSK